jgi:hypothetical protein
MPAQSAIIIAEAVMAGLPAATLGPEPKMEMEMEMEPPGGYRGF